MADPDDPRGYWRRSVRTTCATLAVWLGVTALACGLAPDVGLHVFGWPLGFWIAAQGAVVAYVVAVWWHARRMDRLDREHHREPPGDAGR